MPDLQGYVQVLLIIGTRIRRKEPQRHDVRTDIQIDELKRDTGLLTGRTDRSPGGGAAPISFTGRSLNRTKRLRCRSKPYPGVVNPGSRRAMTPSSGQKPVLSRTCTVTKG
jgi:hypothetical protein